MYVIIDQLNHRYITGFLDGIKTSAFKSSAALFNYPAARNAIKILPNKYIIAKLNSTVNE